MPDKYLKRRNCSCTGATRIKFDKDLKTMIHMFEGTLIDPFRTDSASNHLMNFASGVVTTTPIEGSLLKTLVKGSQMATNFMNQRLILSEEDMIFKSFYDSLPDPLPKSGIKTMNIMETTVRVQSNNVTISDEVMYLRLLAMNSKKSLLNVCCLLKMHLSPEYVQ